MVNGAWSMAHGQWRMVNGAWSMAHAPASYQTGSKTILE
jgi:hypothetical protein